MFGIFKKIKEKKRIKDIEAFCKKINASKFFINQDGSVNISGDIKLTGICDKIPFKINRLKGNLKADSVALKTFENFPNIITGDLSACFNYVTSLEHFPEVKGKIEIYGNPIFELKNVPNFDKLEYASEETPIKLFLSYLGVNSSNIDLFLDMRICVGSSVYLDRLTEFLSICGIPTPENLTSLIKIYNYIIIE